MNESCPECGGKVSGCKWDKSNGIDLQTKTNHLDNYLDKNKSWNEFLEWAKDFTKEGNDFFNYYSYENFGKIGLLIEYLKSVGLRHEKEIVLSDLEVEKLESKVKSLKPKEDDEVEEIKELLFEEGGISIWSEVKMRDLARKAIEILRKK